MKKLIAFFLVSLSSITANADPIADLYQIEVIVFEHLDSNRFSGENWPKFPGKLNVSNAIDLNNLPKNIPESLDTMEVLDALDEAGKVPTKKITSETVNIVEPQNYLLKNELKQFKGSRNEKFIAHMAWSQPLANNVAGIPVYFTAGKDNEITALFNIKPNRNVFSVNISMLYKLQPDDKRYVPNIEEIKITRDVRVKRKEVFYVDHPVIGMIIIISPMLYGTNSYAPLPNM